MRMCHTIKNKTTTHLFAAKIKSLTNQLLMTETGMRPTSTKQNTNEVGPSKTEVRCYSKKHQFEK